MQNEATNIAPEVISIAPIEEGFPGSISHLSTPSTEEVVEYCEVREDEQSLPETLKDSPILSFAIVIISILSLFFLRNFIKLLPSLLASLVRTKEATYIEDNMKLSRYRNNIAIFLIIPFCISITSLNIINSDFIVNHSIEVRFCLITIVFLTYFMIRDIIFSTLIPTSIESSTRNNARRVSYTFFIIIALIAIIASLIGALLPEHINVISHIALYTILAIYIIHLARKMQIFAMSCNVLTAILYLCILEIIPTCIFIAALVVL